MKLLTAELRKRLPRFKDIAEEENPTVHGKFFMADERYTWYLIAFDGKDTLYGWLTVTGTGGENEFGFYSLADIKQLRGCLGLPVERDKVFKPRRLSEIEEPPAWLAERLAELAANE